MNAAFTKLIDENLRLIYAQKCAEDIPERFQELLEKLRGKDKLQ